MAYSAVIELMVEKLRYSIFSKVIFPGFPFRPKGWVALAFNRDKHGFIRMPERVWFLLIDTIKNKTDDNKCFVFANDYSIESRIDNNSYPYSINIEYNQVIDHFKNMEKYLPDFFMVGASEEWALWGDSDLTVLGGGREFMNAIVSGNYLENDSLSSMFDDFDIIPGSDSWGMEEYLRGLLSGSPAS